MLDTESVCSDPDSRQSAPSARQLDTNPCTFHVSTPMHIVSHVSTFSSLADCAMIKVISPHL